MPEQILRPPQVAALLGVSRGTLKRWAVAGVIPKPLQFGPRSFGWPATTIESWIASRAQSQAVAR